MNKKALIVFASLLILIGLYMFLRPPDTAKLANLSSDENATSAKELIGATNIRSFSDVSKNKASAGNATGATSGNKSGSKRVKPAKTPKPLPYPRITINYSMHATRSVGGNDADVNNTFVVVTLDIRNYGYTYFDAHPSRFRGGEIRPLINVSNGKTIDAVIPNGSRAKGSLIFLVKKNIHSVQIKYFPTNTSENYLILYKKVSQYEIDDIKPEVTDDEEG